ncbi:hypothetical protein DMN91_006163, partial [Ooceraea biroi]
MYGLIRGDMCAITDCFGKVSRECRLPNMREDTQYAACMQSVCVCMRERERERESKRRKREKERAQQFDRDRRAGKTARQVVGAFRIPQEFPESLPQWLAE